MMVKAFVSVAALALAGAVPVMAQDVPDIKGTWVSTENVAVVIGSGDHHEDSEADLSAPRASSQSFTLVIDTQDGRRFWGRLSSSGGEEAFLAVFRPDLTSFVGVDDNGYIDGAVTPEGGIELCYRHVGLGLQTTVVACSTFEREG